VAHRRLAVSTEYFWFLIVPSLNDQVLCRLDELPEGGSRGFDPKGLGQTSLFAVRYDSAVHVYADRCPHQGTPLAWRRDAYLNAQGDRIVCAAHGAQFEIDTGLCVLGPCLGNALTAVPWRSVGGHLVIDGEPTATAPVSFRDGKP
jgi:nitrite reductase/ring-hydroxylating ferredoxin subunit